MLEIVLSKSTGFSLKVKSEAKLLNGIFLKFINR